MTSAAAQRKHDAAQRKALQRALLGHAMGEVLGAPLAGMPSAHETAVPRPARVTEGASQAATTCVLAVQHALTSETATPEVAFLGLLTALSEAKAWRGRLAPDLQTLGDAYSVNKVVSNSTIKKTSNPLLAVLLPFAAGPTSDWATAGRIASCLSRQRRVVSAMGLFAGGLRALLQGHRRDDVIAAALHASERVEAEAFAQWDKKLLGHEHEAQGIRALLGGQMQGTTDPRDFLPPPGYDARDDTLRLAFAALLTAFLDEKAALDFVDESLWIGAHVDVFLPLVCAVCAVRHGDGFVDGLQLHLTDKRRFGRTSQPNLVDDEVDLLQKELPPPTEDGAPKSDKNGQLSLL